MVNRTGETMTDEKRSKVGKSNVRRSKSHERRIAHLLTDWTGVEFRRRRVEGRDVTVVERESTADVIPVRGDIIFSIEAKCGECTSLDGLLKDPTVNKFTKWWHQSVYDAEILTSVLKRKIYPMLFFKPAPAFDWVALDKTVFDRNILQPSASVKVQFDLAKARGISPWFNVLGLDAYTLMEEIEHDVSHSKSNAVMKAIRLPSLYLMRWRDLEANVDPKSFFIQT
jgi:hypothetical protein